MEAHIKEWLKENGKRFLKDIGIKEGQIVLDFGCGVGHYTIPAAKIVGKEGKVYAVDKEMSSLNELMQIAKREGLKNIVPIYTNSTELKINLESESIDAVLLYDVLHYMEAAERKTLYREIYRILRTGALLLIYPKHYKLDEPLWNLSNMELEDIVEETKSTKFYLERKCYKKLIHDDDYNMGYILNFRKKKK